MTKALKVGTLRAALFGLPDDMDVVVRTEDTEGNSFCGGVLSAKREEHHHDGEPDFFAIDCSDDPVELDLPLTVEAAVESLQGWCFTDSGGAELDDRRLRQCLVDDVGATGTALPTEAECEQLICGHSDDGEVPRALAERFPKTHAWLDEQLT